MLTVSTRYQHDHRAIRTTAQFNIRTPEENDARLAEEAKIRANKIAQLREQVAKKQPLFVEE